MTKTWIDQYADWAVRRSPLTPRHFHENIALALIAGATAGRCYVQLPHEKVSPNIYILVIAMTSVFAKTTAFNIAREVIRLAMPEKVLIGALTPEAMISELAGKKPSNFKDLDDQAKNEWKAKSQWGARRLFIADEAGRFFNSLKRDYNIGLDALMMELYDASDESISRSTMRDGLVTIKHPALSCLFGTTPMNVHALLSSLDAWASGFWIRWNFVTETNPTEWHEGELIPPPMLMVKALSQVSNGWLSSHNDKPYSVAIDPRVTKCYHEASRQVRDMILSSDDERMHGALSRLPTKHFKAALLSAIIECGGEKPHLELKHWEQVQPLAQRWQQDAEVAVKAGQRTERLSVEEKIFSLIESHMTEGITTRGLQQRTGRSAQEILSIIDTFEKLGTIRKQVTDKKMLWFPVVSLPVLKEKK